MNRIKHLNYFQTGVLLSMLLMILIFSILYPKTISRNGYNFNDTILVKSQENGDTLYSGKIDGQYACFRVTEQNTVLFQYGDQKYGPYTIKEDASAIPPDIERSEDMLGIEIREGDQILFRGGVEQFGDLVWMFNQDGSLANAIGVTFRGSDGIEVDENDQPVNRIQPRVETIYELTHNPPITHKGAGFVWFGAVLICIINAASIFYADELFRFNMRFRIRNPESAEPSDWEITGRYFGWIALCICALVLFVEGLQ